jgi:hypothetical protein
MCASKVGDEKVSWWFVSHPLAAAEQVQDHVTCVKLQEETD